MFELIFILGGLFVAAHAINIISEELYWKWVDWRSKNK